MRLGLGRVMCVVLLVERRSEGAAFSIGCRLLDPPIKSGDDGRVLARRKPHRPWGVWLEDRRGARALPGVGLMFRFGKGTRPAQTVIHQHPAASGREVPEGADERGSATMGQAPLLAVTPSAGGGQRTHAASCWHGPSFHLDPCQSSVPLSVVLAPSTTSWSPSPASRGGERRAAVRRQGRVGSGGPEGPTTAAH